VEGSVHSPAVAASSSYTNSPACHPSSTSPFNDSSLSLDSSDESEVPEMTYLHQMRKMRVLLGRLLRSEGGGGAERQYSGNEARSNVTNDNISASRSTHSLTSDPILSRDALFISLRHVLTELDEFGREVVYGGSGNGVNGNYATGNATAPHHNYRAFCQTMQAFTCAIEKQKIILLQKMDDFEREAVEMVQKEGADAMFLYKASVMSDRGGDKQDDVWGNLKESSSTTTHENNHHSSAPPPLLSEMNVRRKLLHLFRHLKYLHSLMRRTLDKYERVQQEYHRMHHRAPSTNNTDDSSSTLTDSASSHHHNQNISNTPRSPHSTLSQSTLHASDLSALQLPHYQIATYILDLLFEELLHYETLKSSPSSASIYKMLLALFLDTIPPYLEFLDNWLFNGDTSNDYYQEFIVVRNSNIGRMRGSGEYWNKFFEVRDLECVPEFLLSTVHEERHSLMQEILLTGKSIHLMQYIERENLLYDGGVHEGGHAIKEIFHEEAINRPSLQEAFFLSLEKHTDMVVESSVSAQDDKSGRMDTDLHLKPANDRVDAGNESFSVFQSNPSSPVPVGSLSYSSPRIFRSGHFTSPANVGGDSRSRESMTDDEDLDVDVSRALDFDGGQQQKSGGHTSTPLPNSSSLMDTLLNTFSTTIFQTQEQEYPHPNSLFSFSNQIKASDMVHNFDEEPIADLVQQLTKPTLEQLLAGDSPHSSTPDLSSPHQLNKLASAFIPFEQLLHLSLYAHIREQYLRVSPYVVNLLFRHCNLMHHFVALRAIYLMECGDIMHFFSTQLFQLDDKTMGMVDEFNQLELNSMLQEALQFGVEHPRMYSVWSGTDDGENVDDSNDCSSISGNKFDIFQSICVQDRLRIVIQHNEQKSDNTPEHKWKLLYEAEYPLNTIISTDAIDTYNSVLSLLLEISQCKYLLDHIRLPGRGAPDIRHAHILLYQMRQFVNTLHQYIKTRIVDECWKDFLDQISRATNLDCIIEAHNDYLNAIQQKCLLRGPPPIFLKEIRNILELGKLFHKKCQVFASEFCVVKGMQTGADDGVPASQRQTQTPTFETFGEAERLKQRLRNSVTRISSEFESHVRTLEGLLQRLLKRGIHPELRDLEMRLDFNRFYRGGSG